MTATFVSSLHHDDDLAGWLGTFSRIVNGDLRKNLGILVDIVGREKLIILHDLSQARENYILLLHPPELRNLGFQVPNSECFFHPDARQRHEPRLDADEVLLARLPRDGEMKSPRAMGGIVRDREVVLDNLLRPQECLPGHFHAQVPFDFLLHFQDGGGG